MGVMIGARGRIIKFYENFRQKFGLDSKLIIEDNNVVLTIIVLTS